MFCERSTIISFDNFDGKCLDNIRRKTYHYFLKLITYKIIKLIIFMLRQNDSITSTSVFRTVFIFDNIHLKFHDASLNFVVTLRLSD